MWTNKVLKRDGTEVAFDENKIINAVMAAGASSETTSEVLYWVCSELAFLSKVTVEKLQIIVIENLQDLDPETAKRYKDYADARTIAREKTSALFKNFLHVLERTDESLLRENANKASERIPTMRDLIAGQATKQYVLKHLMPKEVASAHNDGTIHIHDTDYIGLPQVNCCLLDVAGMLQHGFRMGNAHISPPKSIATAASILCQILGQVSSHNYGGTTIPEIDKVLEPYAEMSWQKHFDTGAEWIESDCEEDSVFRAYADAMTQKEIKDAVQGIEYEINTLHTSNGQTPFSTLTLGRGTSWFAREIQKAILEQRILGLGAKGDTPVFPKLCFYREKGVNHPGDPNYDIFQLAVKCSSLRLYPDYLDVEKLEENIGGVPAPMGCRSFLGVHPEGYTGRSNLGVTSVNVVRCALKANGDLEVFWQELENAIMLAKKALDVRIETCKKIKAEVAPILYMEGAFGLRTDDPQELVFDRFFANRRASISLGYIGLYETCMALCGEGPHESEEAHKLAEDILQYLRNKVEIWKEAENLGYSLYGSPAENLCGRFCGLDTKLFGSIKNITDKGYYQNGFNVDVRARLHPMRKVEIEEAFPKIATGGFISYAELPKMKNNLEGLEQVIRFALDRVPYYAINTPVDSCHICNFQGDFEINDGGYYHCPVCENDNPYEMTVVKRVSGYLTSPQHRPMPVGKTKEVKLREKNLEQEENN